MGDTLFMPLGSTLTMGCATYVIPHSTSPFGVSTSLSEARRHWPRMHARHQVPPFRKAMVSASDLNTFARVLRRPKCSARWGQASKTGRMPPELAPKCDCARGKAGELDGRVPALKSPCVLCFTRRGLSSRLTGRSCT